MMRTWLALTALVLGGCDLYFNGDDEPCKGYGYGAEPAPAQQYRDPYTGTCIDAGGGWEGCDDSCGPCPAYDIAAPDMGLCYSSCTGLEEGTCLATAGCQASYDVAAAGDGPAVFSGCWQTAPSGGWVEGGCQGLDAQSCSREGECAVVYDVLGGGGSGTMERDAKFLACQNEPSNPQYCLDDSACGDGAHCDMTTCYPDPTCTDCPTCGACAQVCYGVCVSDTPSCAATDCGPGYHCEEQCYPTDGQNGPTMGWCNPACVPDEPSCNLIDCGPGYECVESCDVSANDTLWCSAQCVPSGGEPGSCYGQVTCDAIGPACPAGTTAGIINGCYTGYCIPNADCGPNDPGECYGDVTCTSPAPACPSGTTAGIANGCYTGYCIPNNQCSAPACESLSSESACTARMDCSPVYTGTNCTCDANGCTCQSLSFARCESWWL